MRLSLFLPLLICIGNASAQEVSLRLGGKEIALGEATAGRLAALAQARLARCGPNTSQHPHNFGLAAYGAGARWQRLAAGSRLRVRFKDRFTSESHLGGTLGVSEALIGLEQGELFVGPDFTRQGGAVTEHLQCEYLPALELACLPELASHLPARYRETCAALERDADGRIVLPPPDIAPSCS